MKAGQLKIGTELGKLQVALGSHEEEDRSFKDEVVNVTVSSANSQDSQAPCMKENERVLRSLAISVFKMQNLPVGK